MDGWMGGWEKSLIIALHGFDRKSNLQEKEESVWSI